MCFGKSWFSNPGGTYLFKIAADMKLAMTPSTQRTLCITPSTQKPNCDKSTGLKHAKNAIND